MDHRAERNILQGQGIAHHNISVWPGDDLVANLKSKWIQNVAFLAVRIVQQADKRRAVGVVFYGSDAARDCCLVALEVDETIVAFVTAAPMPDREPTQVVAP